MLITLTQYITDLLDEYTAQTNEGTSLAVLVVARKGPISNLSQNPDRQRRTDARAQIKCTYYRKIRYIEAECYTKYPKKKEAFDKIIAEKKAEKVLKKQQALLKDTLKTYVANATILATLLAS